MTKPTSDQVDILVAEDEPELADLYSIWLNGNFEVRTAYHGQEAIDLMDERVRAVVLDRRMPNVSGDEALAKLRDQGYDVPVAFISAVEPDVDILDMDFTDYIIKPTSRDVFQETIERLVMLAEAGPEVREYYQLKAKQAALDMAQRAWEARSSDQYLELQTRLDQLEKEVDLDNTLEEGLAR